MMWNFSHINMLMIIVCEHFEHCIYVDRVSFSCSDSFGFGYNRPSSVWGNHCIKNILERLFKNCSLKLLFLKLRQNPSKIPTRIQSSVALLKVNSNNSNKLESYPCLYFSNLGIVFFKKDLLVATSEINIVPAGTSCLKSKIKTLKQGVNYVKS